MRRDDTSVPKLSWHCKTCKRPDGERLVNYGYRTDCLRCHQPKSKCNGGDIRPSNPSVSTRRPANAPSPSTRTAQEEEHQKLRIKYKDMLKQLSAVQTECRELKLEKGGKPAATDDEPAAME